MSSQQLLMFKMLPTFRAYKSEMIVLRVFVVQHRTGILKHSFAFVAWILCCVGRIHLVCGRQFVNKLVVHGQKGFVCKRFVAYIAVVSLLKKI